MWLLICVTCVCSFSRLNSCVHSSIEMSSRSRTKKSPFEVESSRVESDSKYKHWRFWLGYMFDVKWYATIYYWMEHSLDLLLFFFCFNYGCVVYCLEFFVFTFVCCKIVIMNLCLFVIDWAHVLCIKMRVKLIKLRVFMKFFLKKKWGSYIAIFISN